LEIATFIRLFAENVFRFPSIACFEMKEAGSSKVANVKSQFYGGFDRLSQKIDGSEKGTRRINQDVL
jgi:hypothetical protein